MYKMWYLSIIFFAPITAIGASPSEFSCTYKNSKSGGIYEAGGETQDDAEYNAKWECQIRNSGSSGNPDKCKLLHCRAPTACPALPTDNNTVENLQEIKQIMKCQKNVIVGEKDVTISSITALIRSKAESRLQGERAKLAEEVISANKINSIVNMFRPKFENIAQSYGQFMRSFTTEYQISYSNASNAIKTAAGKASHLRWRELVGLRMDLIALDDQEARGALRYETGARFQLSTITDLCASYSIALSPHKNFLKEKGMPFDGPEVICNKAKEKLSAVIEHVKDRRERISSATQTLNKDIEVHINALQSLEVDSITKETRITSARLNASASFIDVVNSISSKLWEKNATHPKLGLPYFGDQLQKFHNFESIKQQCNNVTISNYWMETGCIYVRRDWEGIQNYLNTVIPTTVTVAIQIIEQKASEEQKELISKIKTFQAPKDIGSIVTSYDMLLSTVEE